MKKKIKAALKNLHNSGDLQFSKADYKYMFGYYPNIFHFHIKEDNFHNLGLTITKDFEDERYQFLGKVSKEEAVEEAIEYSLSYTEKINAKRVNGLPSLDEYVYAFKNISLDDTDKAMLKGHYHAPERKMQAYQLTEIYLENGGYIPEKSGHSGAYHYGSIGDRIAEKLELDMHFLYEKNNYELHNLGTDPYRFLCVLCENIEDFTEFFGGHAKFRMRNEVAEALKILGWV